MDLSTRVRATRDQIKDFKKSILWKDIKRELGVWKKGCSHEMQDIVRQAEINDPSTASVLMHMGDINGRLKCIDYILSMPDLFLDLLEEREDESTDSE